MFQVGKIVKPHGIKGYLKVYPYTTEKNRFVKGTVYTINDNEYTIEDVKHIGNCIIIKFYDINTRNDAELFRNHIVYVKQEDLVPLKENEYYVHSVFGLSVFDINNQFMGKIKEVFFIGENTYIELDMPENNGTIILFKKQFIKKVNLNKKTVILTKTKDFYEY